LALEGQSRLNLKRFNTPGVTRVESKFTGLWKFEQVW
jgi:hypothetical protein